MNDIEMNDAEFSAWIDESFHSLAVLAELDSVLAGRNADLQAQVKELVDQLGDAGIDSPEALEQALAALPAHEASAEPELTPPRPQGKRRLVPKV